MLPSHWEHSGAANLVGCHHGPPGPQKFTKTSSCRAWLSALRRSKARLIEPETLRSCGKKREDAGGKLWSTYVWCLVPVFQHDFGCCDVLIGGEPSLKKARPTPMESLLWAPAEPSLCLHLILNRPWGNGGGVPEPSQNNRETVSGERACVSTLDAANKIGCATSKFLTGVDPCPWPGPGSPEAAHLGPPRAVLGSN